MVMTNFKIIIRNTMNGKEEEPTHYNTCFIDGKLMGSQSYLHPVYKIEMEEHGKVWRCLKCAQDVEPFSVTFEETHEGCGGKCV